MKKLKKRGFTLVELVITMLIIITLSLLSFPLLSGRHRTSSKLSEGYALLGAVVDAQISYYNEFGSFLSPQHSGNGWGGAVWGYNCFTCNDPVLGINAINNRFFTSFNAYGGNVRLAGLGGFNYHFTAIVRSANAGTISIEYNVTKRFDPVVSGV